MFRVEVIAGQNFGLSGYAVTSMLCWKKPFSKTQPSSMAS